MASNYDLGYKDYKVKHSYRIRYTHETKTKNKHLCKSEIKLPYS
jgi:hypothetical protein